MLFTPVPHELYEVPIAPVSKSKHTTAARLMNVVNKAYSTRSWPDSSAASRRNAPVSIRSVHKKTRRAGTVAAPARNGRQP